MRFLSSARGFPTRTALAMVVPLVLCTLLVCVASVNADGGAIDQPRSGAIYWYNPATSNNIIWRTYRAAGDFTAVNEESVGGHTSGSFLTGNVSTLEPTSWPSAPDPLFYQGAVQVSTFAPLAMVHMETVTPRWNITDTNGNRANDYSPLIYTAQVASPQARHSVRGNNP